FDSGRGDGPEDVPRMSLERLCRYRREAQYVFQDPYASLNPRMTVREIVTEPLEIHGVGDVDYRIALAAELLALVGLDPRALGRYTHSFSGGQRQRIGVARALALKPQLLICDEPVSALDVSVQAQVLNLLNDLRGALGHSYLFISHNLAVVKYVADRIAVMCAGRIVEMGPAQAVIADPLHPYTRALIAAAPEPSVESFGGVARLAAARIGPPASWPKPFAWRDGAVPIFDRHASDHIVLLGDAA
ncbi:MAG: ATP-binding cassette domain-containing protein, partial [Pseudomonadota bacterium]